MNLKKSAKFFQRSQPHAAKMITVPREMNALDLLSYYHDNKLACLNVSQSLHCMPMVASHQDPLPCLTCGPKLCFFGCSKEYNFSESYTQMFSSLGSIKLITSFSCLGPMANSWCYPRTRRSPAFWLEGSCWYWWGCLSIEWLALIKLLNKCLNRTISII